MDTEKKTIGQFLKGYLQQSLDMLRHPIRLLPTLLIAIIWMVLSLMASKAELFLPLKVVSFLTFAQGGMYGGFFGAVGGIVGKVVVVAFVNSLVMPLFDKRRPFQGFSHSFSNMFSSLSIDSARGLSPLFNGAGAALLLYGLMNLTQTGQNAMVGIVAAVMLLQSIGNQGGFMFGLLFAAANSLTKGRTPSYVTVTRVLTGMTFGFSFGVALSVAGFRFTPFFAIPLLIAGILFGLLGKKASKAQQQQVLPPPPPPVPTPNTNSRQFTPNALTVLLCLLLLPATLSAQKKEGTWVEPVQFFHLDKKGNLDLNGIADAMWEKERYIMGFKARVCNITPIGDDPEDAKVPFNPLTFYVYLNEPTTVTVISDWSGDGDGLYSNLGVYTLTASQILFTYDKNSNRYSFDYYPEGGYDYDHQVMIGKESLDLSEHHKAIPSKVDMSLFYTQRGGLRGYYEVTILEIDDDEELGHSETEDTKYVQFQIEEVLLDGDVKELSEEDRLKLIEQMDDLTKTLKEYMEETGDHSGPIPTTIINIISTIGSVLVGGGIASATGSSIGSVLGDGPSGGGGGGGNPTPDTPSDGLPPEPEKKKEEEEKTEPKEPEDPLGENRAYWNKYMKENPDGTLTMKDPITGKPLTYYPTPDGGYESEMGTHYSQESLAENVRYRAENSGYFKDAADQAAKNVAEQRAQNAKLNAEIDAKGQAYREQKAAEEAAEKQAAEMKQAQMEKLAKKYGLEGEDAKNQYVIYDMLKKEQASAELEHKRQMQEAAFYDYAYRAAQTIDDAATTAINIMGELVPGEGRAIKNLYTMAHSVVSSTSEAYAKGESIGKAVVNGAIDGGLGVLQNQAGDIASNVWTEGAMVVGAEGIKEGLKAISSGKNPDEVLDTMKKAMTHKTNYFIVGKQTEKAVGWINKSAGQSLSPKDVNFKNDTGLRLGENTAKSIQKALTKTDTMDLAKGIPSAVQEVGATYTGNWGRDSKVDFVTDEAIPGIVHDVEYYSSLVKDFSNAAAKIKQSQTS